MSAPQAILSIRDLHVAYGGIQAVKGVEMDFEGTSEDWQNSLVYFPN